MTQLKRILLIIGLYMMPHLLLAQDKTVEMADTMRSNGRIYVVVAVMLTILIGLIIYMVRLDRKMTRVEKENR